MRGQEELITSFPVRENDWPVWTKLKAGFLLLVGFELVVGWMTLWTAHHDHPIDISKGFSSLSSEATLFLLIVLGTVVAGSLFWMLGSYVIRSRALLDQLNDGVCVTDRDWRVRSFNRSFSRIIGLSPEQITGQSILALIPDFHDSCVPGPGLERLEHEFEGVRSSGERYCAQISVLVLAEENGKPVSCMVILRDMTELKRSQRHIHQLAFVDELTGLANRAQSQRRLHEAIERARRNDGAFAVLFLDLDGFKVINDSMGHVAGDLVLSITAERLQGVLRSEDMVARLGGDEFCMLLDGLGREKDVLTVAERCLQAIGKPMTIGDRTLRIGGSIGIAMFPRDGRTSNTILQAADTAMYAAKHAGKNRCALYSPEFTKEAEQRLSLEHDLREAIEKQQFELFYQPQVSLHTGRLSGVEALIRWQHPKRGMVSPLEFIPVVERIGMINELGEWVIDTACRQAAEWMAAGLPEFSVAVNISGSHFRESSLVDSVRRALTDYQLPATRLELEVTEGVMQLGGQSIEIFNRIKALGVKVAIDDFGTGYSSLSSLKNLPVDSLKIDKAFVDDLLEKHEDRVILATIVGMGQALEMEVVVEGVESIEHVLYLKGLNCDVLQGYFFSKPVPAGEIPALAEKSFFPTAGMPI